MNIRHARYPDDLERLQELSPPVIKHVSEFFIFPTLVAEIDGVIAGYTQFTVTPDRVFHSMAIRIGKEYKGQGVGQALADNRVAFGRAAGCIMHFALVDADGEEAMKKILVKQGLHLCQKRDKDKIWIYVGDMSHD